MTKTFFFYDLETSGLKPSEARIMQFAGRRTDMNLQPIGEPYNLLVKLSDDTLPSPEALLVTGITPQQTLEEGVSEVDFAQLLLDDVFTPDTIAVGFNNVRFDDEFVRNLFWRTFRDPYEWSWKDGRSRWDLLDVVRLTRALRPEGIEWPVDEAGQPTNRLELLTKLNGIEHANAHDALSDVDALIAITGLIKTKQPQLFDYLLKMRDKKAVQSLVNLEDRQPFVYGSGRLDNQFNKATVALPLAAGRNNNIVVYDLRYDPSAFIDMTPRDIEASLFADYETRQSEGFQSIPVKELQYNRCPAVAPLGVLERDDGWAKLQLDYQQIEKNRQLLMASPHFAENIRTAFELRPDYPKSTDPEARLYDGFVHDKDKIRIESVRNAKPAELADYHPAFDDDRLAPLLLHYKARNYPNTLSDDEVASWEAWRSDRLQRAVGDFAASLQRLAGERDDEKSQFVLQELQLWAESIVPVEDD